MKRLLVILFALVATASVRAEEVAFYIGQASEEWAFNVTGKGRALVGESLVYAQLDNIKIVNNPKHAKRKSIKDVEVAFGYYQPDGKWNVKHVGGRRPVNEITDAGDSVTLDGLNATLSLTNAETPRDYWVVVIIWLSDTQTVYAHSRKDIF